MVYDYAHRMTTKTITYTKQYAHRETRNVQDSNNSCARMYRRHPCGPELVFTWANHRRDHLLWRQVLYTLWTIKKDFNPERDRYAATLANDVQR